MLYKFASNILSVKAC